MKINVGTHKTLLPRIRDLSPGTIFRYASNDEGDINVYIVLSSTTKLEGVDSVADTIRVVGLGETEVLVVPSNDRAVALEIHEVYLEDIR